MINLKMINAESVIKMSPNNADQVLDGMTGSLKQHIKDGDSIVIKSGIIGADFVMEFRIENYALRLEPLSLEVELGKEKMIQIEGYSEPHLWYAQSSGNIYMVDDEDELNYIVTESGESRAILKADANIVPEYNPTNVSGLQSKYDYEYPSTLPRPITTKLAVDESLPTSVTTSNQPSEFNEFGNRESEND